jgi:alpha-amylase
MQTFLNHNSGGQLENNPIQEHKPILTLLEAGKFPRTSADFYKIHTQTMTKVFLGFPDLAHVTPNVQNWLWLRTDG